jgi:hypothetical protein
MKGVLKRFVLLTFAIAAAGEVSSAQVGAGRVRDVNPHSWWVYYGDHRIANSKWGILSEVQIRRTKFGSAWQQSLLRDGISYQLSPNVQLGGGYGFIRTSRYGDFPAAQPFNEHRLFEQVIVKDGAGPVDLEHRYRLEQRWLGATSGGVRYSRYQDRFRYQLRASLPLPKVGGGQMYLFGGDELFIHFGPNHGASAFDQNRAFAGIGFKLNPTTRLELSYLNQFLVQRSNLVEESNHTFRIQVTSLARLFGKR